MVSRISECWPEGVSEGRVSQIIKVNRKCIRCKKYFPSTHGRSICDGCRKPSEKHRR